MTSPSVGVIIPTHNRPVLLRRALASLQAQTLPPREVHVVENGCRAGAEAVVDQAGGAARGLFYAYLPAPDFHAARNEGLRHCQTKYVAFLDDDDEWLPEKLARQVARLEAEPALGWIGCRVWRVDPSGEAAIAESPLYRGSPTLAALVSEWCFIWTPSAVVIRRSCLQRVGPFNVRYRVAGDYELYLRLARRFPFAVLDEALVRYHQHADNVSRNLHRTWREILVILAALRPEPRQDLTRAVIRDAMGQYGRWLYGLATHAREHRRPAEAARYLATALRYAPDVGLRLPWARFRAASYRAARPYVLLATDLVSAGLMRFRGDGQEFASGTSARASGHGVPRDERRHGTSEPSPSSAAPPRRGGASGDASEALGQPHEISRGPRA